MLINNTNTYPPLRGFVCSIVMTLAGYVGLEKPSFLNTEIVQKLTC